MSTAQSIYSIAQIRELEHLAQTRYTVSGDEMMQRAGQAAFAELLRAYPECKTLTVFCGTGNNGGDGYVLARIAQEKGLKVHVYQVGDVTKLANEALRAYQACQKIGVACTTFDANSALPESDVLVDAIVGIGMQGMVHGDVLFAIEKINQTRLPVIAMDIPSGLDADTGTVLGAATQAALTITFIGLKMGLLTGQGAAFAGRTICADIDLPAELFAQVECTANALQLDLYSEYLKPRSRDLHKGLAGHVLIIGGDHGYSGAARMAAEAALRVGAGLVSVATLPEHAQMMNIARPEMMCHGVTSARELQFLLDKVDVIAIGPGMGQSAWAKTLLKAVLQSKHRLVVDADALNLLAQAPQQRDNWILTPHPGEAARLLGCKTSEIQADRLTAIKALQDKYEGTIVLKGAGTLVLAESIPGVCLYGNPGMATAGMGDILTGVIVGLLAQGIPNAVAAELGVCLHAKAGDLAAKQGERGMIATDLLPYLRELVNPSHV